MLGFLLFAVGVVLVVKGADWLVDGSSSMARRLGVSDLAIGLTVVAFGTSLPELTVNLFAVVQNQPEVAIGNVTGSNICNFLLILGVSSIVCPLSVQRSTVWKEIPFSLLAQLLLLAMAMDVAINGAASNILTRTEGFSLLAMFAVFMAYIAGMAQDLPQISQAGEHKILTLGKSTLFILLGLALLIVGGKLVVEGAIAIAERFNLAKGFVAVTLVAVGTSLPELATSLVAACKKKADIAVGNVVGSNIFNIFFILGVSSSVKPVPVPSDMMLSIYVGILATVVLFMALFIGRRHCIDRWNGALMLGLYVVYLILQPR